MTRFEELTDDLARLRTGFVNVYFVGRPGGAWTLVDGGMSVGTTTIQAVAASRFRLRPPEAVVLTHAHFDHVGALPALLKQWRVPVYAHPLELPFVTGAADYPALDESIAESVMEGLTRLVPRGGIDLGRHVRVLPESDRVPSMDGWRWIHTPGHTPGHISLFRDADRVLIAGDAVMTSRQGSAFSVTTQSEELNGPPLVFTSDWAAARRSVAALAALRPLLLAAGHGSPLRGETLAADLDRLVREFDWRMRARAVPPASETADAPTAASVHLPTEVSGGGAPSRHALFYAALAGAAVGVVWMSYRRAVAERGAREAREKAGG